MGEDDKKSVYFYSIEDKEKIEEFKELKPLPLAEGNILNEYQVNELLKFDKASVIPKIAKATGEKNKCVGVADLRKSKSGELTLTVLPKTITRKRFIKLLMGRGCQRNTAIKIHQEYMKLYKNRTMIGMIFFISFYEENQEIESIKIKVEGKENVYVNCKSRQRGNTQF